MALVKEIMGSSSHVLDRSSPFITSSSKILGLNKNLLFYPTNGKRFCVSCVEKGDSQIKKVVRTSPISAISDKIGRIVPEKPVRFKVRAVVTVKNKNKEDLKETIVKQLDAFTDKIGRNVVLELVSSDTDPSKLLFFFISVIMFFFNLILLLTFCFGVTLISLLCAFRQTNFFSIRVIYPI